MILICDSGSTKATWGIIDEKHFDIFHTKGINPSLHSVQDILLCIKNEVLPKIKSDKKITSVKFFGAGCTKKGIEMLEPILSQSFNCNAICKSDIYASAISTIGLDEGIVAILGTGSNSAYFKSGEITFKAPALGYVLGDEGSGSFLGKRLLSDYLKKQMPKTLSVQLSEKYRLNESEIIEAVYRKPYPNRYMASFTHFISDNINTQYCTSLVMKGFVDFFELYILKYKHLDSKTIAFTGSIASIFNSQLEDTCALFGFALKTIVQNPMEGLIKYYKNV